MDLIASSPDKAIKKLLDFNSPKATPSALPTREFLDSPYRWKSNQRFPEALQPVVVIPALKISESPFDLPMPNPDADPYVESSESSIDDDDDDSVTTNNIKSRKRKRDVLEIEEVVDIAEEEEEDDDTSGETKDLAPSLLSRVKGRRRSAVKVFDVTTGSKQKSIKLEKTSSDSDSEIDTEPGVVPLEEATCFLCSEKGNKSCQGAMQEIGVFKISTKRPVQYFAHENCSFFASKHENETPESFLKRTASYNMPCKHKECKQRRAALGCSITSCPNIYHYKCAKQAKGEMCITNSVVRFFCAHHIGKALEDKITSVQWPLKSAFDYLFRNDWNGISRQHYIEIESNKFLWEKFRPEWFHRDLGARVAVREIFPGHWAWCEDLASLGKRKKHPSKQYEVVALEDFESQDFIGEYVGKVLYQKEIGDSKYVAMFYFPNTAPQSLKDNPMCIDAQMSGNEMRFINSVSPVTPPDITQNATMSTVWCRGELRIVISATRNIAKNEAIVLNYNEYANSFFDEKISEQDRAIAKAHAGCTVFISKEDMGPEPSKQNMMTAKLGLNKIMIEEDFIAVSVDHNEKSTGASRNNTPSKPGPPKPKSQASITRFFKPPMAQEKNGSVPRSYLKKQSSITSWFFKYPKPSNNNNNKDKDKDKLVISLDE